MSKDHALAFIDAAFADDDLVGKIKATHGEPDALLALAKELGYEFSWAEWLQP